MLDSDKKVIFEKNYTFSAYYIQSMSLDNSGEQVIICYKTSSIAVKFEVWDIAKNNKTFEK